jgi:multicomponent Na+:H+ antiporter subunit D
MLTVPALVLAAAGLAAGLVPGLRDALGAAGERFVDRPGYASAVLHGRGPGEISASLAAPGALDVVLGLVTVLGAVGIAYLALAPARPRLHRVGVVTGEAINRLRWMHSGYVGDYVTWLVAGAAVLGGLFAITLTT